MDILVKNMMLLLPFQAKVAAESSGQPGGTTAAVRRRVLFLFSCFFRIGVHGYCRRSLAGILSLRKTPDG